MTSTSHAMRLSLSLEAAGWPRVNVEGEVKRAVELARRRMAFAAVLFAFSFIVLAGRITEIALFGGVDAPVGARKAAEHTLRRADIVDRNGALIATNLPTASLYADPRAVIDVDETARALAGALPGLNVDDLRRKLASPRSFVWLERGLAPAQQAAVHALGLPGIAFADEERRVYPQGSLLAHVLGYTDIDNQGIAGVEKTLDETLRRHAIDGEGPLALSLDVRAQAILREELERSLETFQAVGATGLILDPTTGEVLALSSLPDFDPNRPASEATDEQLFNRATLGVYEMGSIFKVFTTAMALDYGVVGLADGFDATSPIRVARYTINDTHPKARWLSVPEVFIYSSNIGSAKMGMAVGAERQRAFLERVGLLDPLTLELPEVGQPMEPRTWGELATMTVAFGHGVAVTPIQTAAAFSAMVNGGTLIHPTLLKRAPGPAPGVRVVDKATSDAMRALLRLVVLDGTGKGANVPGYSVGGKTGTAEKASARGYRRDALLSSFIAAFPMDAPRFVVLVTLDEPKGTEATFGYATGGWTAAPTVKRIIERLAPLYGLAPVEHEPIEDEMAITFGGTSLLASLPTP
jgi:cell division protein FtsI (penicillin-binding protein 3)